MRRDHNDGKPGVPRLDGPGNLKPADVRQPDVEQDDVGVYSVHGT